MNKFKIVAVTAAKKAGKELLKEYKNFDRSKVKLKASHEILTKADLASEKIILQEIKNNFPGHRILSEEAGINKKKSDYLWVVDPLDGTTNFSMHNPIWSVSIGLAHKKRIILGVVFAPILDELYIAELGKGARMNNKKIKVSKNAKTDKVLNTFCHARQKKHVKRAIKYYSYQKLHALDCRQLGSAALELAYVAAGRIESIMIPGANAWDVAAGVLLVREAGGQVTDFSGENWDLLHKDILASNGRVHGDLLRIIKKVKIS